MGENCAMSYEESRPRQGYAGGGIGHVPTDSRGVSVVEYSFRMMNIT
jgi:hypothetical protein